MTMKRHLILAIHVTDRLQHAIEVQRVLTEFGRWIKTRLGLHESSEAEGSPNGLLILEILDHEDIFQQLQQALGSIEGIEVAPVVFDHP